MEWIKDFTPQWMEYKIGDASAWTWLSLGLSTVLVWMLLVFLRRHLRIYVDRFASYTQTHLDDVLALCLVRTNKLFLFVLALVLCTQALAPTLHFEDLVNKVGIVALFLQTAVWGNVWIAYALERYFEKRSKLHGATGEGGASFLASYGAISVTAKFVLWTVILLLLLDNLGVDITALVTGLGIGGIAIALALQNILGDIFASLTIILDKPFEAGDFIIVGDMQGTVESVGLKTTRIRSLAGEQWIFPNKQLIESGVQNYKRMNERRIQFGFGVTYDTPLAELKQIPKLMEAIIREQGQTRFDRAHFKVYSESSLDFEVVYFMLSPDYKIYMDTQQEINFQMFKVFQDRGIEFAFPTRTMIVRNEIAPEESKPSHEPLPPSSFMRQDV